jgi:hypothetical protein
MDMKSTSRFLDTDTCRLLLCEMFPQKKDVASIFRVEQLSGNKHEAGGRQKIVTASHVVYSLILNM